jgi:hypothetical protein
MIMLATLCALNAYLDFAGQVLVNYLTDAIYYPYDNS